MRFFCFLLVISLINLLNIGFSVDYPQPHAPYYSQCGQDIFLHEHVFFNKSNGVFIDIGAHDGISFSNTYFFEKELNWHGICFEPNPDVFSALKKNRRSFCYDMCVADYDGTSNFLKIIGAPEMLSGLVDKYDSRHLARVDLEINRDSGIKEIIPIRVCKLNTILEKHGICEVDLLCIDTEGSELDILKGIDYDAVRISVILVENNFRESHIKDFLSAKGFKLIKSIDADDVYFNRN